MRSLLPRLLLLLGLAATPAVPGFAQVTVDLHALDAPPTARPPDGQAAAPKPAPRRVPPRRTAAKPPRKAPASAPAPAQPGAPAPAIGSAAPAPPKPIPPAAANPATPPLPVVGVTPPPIAVIPPPPAPDAPMAPVPPPTISATAATSLDTLPAQDGAGVRLDFAHGESDLTQGTANAVKALVAATPKDATTTFNVMAYATGVAEDPSTARRLSLSRALSVRSALMAYGVPSTHIYVRALGAAQPGDGPADRVDVLVMGANASAPPPGPSAATPPADAATRTP